MKEKSKFLKYLKSIGLFLAACILAIVSFPAYVIYAFGKALCDKDEISDFYQTLWETLMGMNDINNCKAGISIVDRQNQKLKQYIEDIKKAPYQKDNMNEAAKYNAMWDVIHKYNEEFNIKD